jgi:hypothetical protein
MSQTETKSNEVVVNRSMLIGNIFHLLFWLGLGVLYVYAYVVMPTNYKNERISKWFLAYIVAHLAGSVVLMFKVGTIVDNFGRTISRGVWERLQQIERFPFSLLRYAGLTELITGCYIAIKYVPFADCYVYGDVVNTELVCTSMRIISVITILRLSIIGLMLFIFCTCGCCYCCLSARGYDTNMNFTINGTNVLSKNFLRTNYLIPIPVPNDSEETCSICTTSVEENGTATWSTLSCNHKFHVDCITEWLTYRQTCPLCRKDAVVVHGIANSV